MQPSLCFWREFLLPAVHQFAQPCLLGSGARFVRRVWVLSASGPVRFCQLAGSPACHVQLCVARANHCQPRLVSSAQLPPAGRSRCSCPATAGFGRVQLPISAAPSSSPSAIRSRCSRTSLRVSAGALSWTSRLASSLTSRWAPGSSTSLGLTFRPETSRQASSLPPANVVGKGLLLTSLSWPSPPLGPSGPVTSW